jgi:hypothetical protein
MRLLPLDGLLAATGISNFSLLNNALGELCPLLSLWLTSLKAEKKCILNPVTSSVFEMNI